VAAPVVRGHRELFEAAAFYFLTWGQTFDVRTPYELQRKLKGVARAAKALLQQLGIADPAAAIDGPGDRELFDVLSFTDGATDDIIADAPGKIGRLAEILSAIDAAYALERIAERAASERETLASLTAARGNAGDVAVNRWVAALISIYTRITKKLPGTSVGAPLRDNEGEAGGPLIRFLQEAASPVNRWIDDHRGDLKEDERRAVQIPLSAAGFRRRIRDIRATQK
jgi:hypothetical protein